MRLYIPYKVFLRTGVFTAVMVCSFSGGAMYSNSKEEESMASGSSSRPVADMKYKGNKKTSVLGRRTLDECSNSKEFEEEARWKRPKIDPKSSSASAIPEQGISSDGLWQSMKKSIKKLGTRTIDWCSKKAYDNLPMFMTRQGRYLKTLSYGMDKNDTLRVKKTLDRISMGRLGAFIQVAQDLTQGINPGRNKVIAIEVLGKVSGEHLDEFVTAAQKITQGVRSEWDKANVIEALVQVPAKRLKEEAFVTAAQALIQEMDGLDKANVIETLVSIPERYLTKQFTQAAQTITHGMGEYKGIVIRTLLRALAEHLDAFVTAAQTLTQGVDEWNKANVIEVIFRLPEEHLDRFIRAPQDLTQSMGGRDKGTVIRALLRAPEEHLEAFVDAARTITQGMRGGYKAKVVEAILRVPREYLGIFVESAQALTQEVDEWNKANIIEILERVPSECLDVFVRAAQDLTQKEIDKWDKVQVIYALVRVPVERLTEKFIRGVQTLTQGMDGKNKANVIKTFLRVPEERWGDLQTVMQEKDMLAESKVMLLHAFSSVASTEDWGVIKAEEFLNSKIEDLFHNLSQKQLDALIRDFFAEQTPEDRRQILERSYVSH